MKVIQIRSEILYRYSTPIHFSDTIQILPLFKALHVIKTTCIKTAHIPAANMLSGITVKSSSYRLQSEEECRAKTGLGVRPDLTSKCSKCCYSCIWLSWTQVTSGGGLTGPMGKTLQRKESVNNTSASSCTDHCYLWERVGYRPQKMTWAAKLK